MNSCFKIICIVTFILAPLSCNQAKKEAKSIVDNWYGKEIVFTPNLQAYSSGKMDNSHLDSLLNSEVKVVTYIDASCSVCIVELYKWEGFMDFLEQYDISVLVIVDSETDARFDPLSESYLDINYPLIHDKDNLFRDRNNLYDKQGLTSFLLDQNNCVILVGNPIQNEEIKNLYINTISKKEILLL